MSVCMLSKFALDHYICWPRYIMGCIPSLLYPVLTSLHQKCQRHLDMHHFKSSLTYNPHVISRFSHRVMESQTCTHAFVLSTKCVGFNLLITLAFTFPSVGSLRLKCRGLRVSIGTSSLVRRAALSYHSRVCSNSPSPRPQCRSL